MVNTYQWQAQPVAQPPEAAVEATAVDEASALLAAEPPSAGAAEGLSEVVEAVEAAAAGAAPPPLKSVAYQPEPLS